MSGLNEQDVNLIRDAMKGNPDAFTTLVAHYKDFVYRSIYAVLQHHADAEDAAQETFIKAYQSLPRLRDVRTFPSWLARIAVRTALDGLKRNERMRATVRDLDTVMDTNDAHLSSGIRMDLEQALSQMSTEHRSVLVLRELHGFDYEELAQIFEIPIGTVRSRLYHARSRLRQLMQEEGSVHSEL